MNVVDSSAWIEYLTDGPNASFFAKPIYLGYWAVIVGTVFAFLWGMRQDKAEAEGEKTAGR